MGDEKMPVTYKISEKEAEKIKEYRKTIRDKKTDKRLYAVQLRGEGFRNKEIGEKLDVNPKLVSRWVSAYVKDGIESLLPKERPANHKNMSYEEEEEFLSQYLIAAEKGQIIVVNEIKTAYVERVGHSIGNNQIYRVLNRHGWRKVMPRSRHPKKASDEAIEASKKLKIK